jgi:hypothetical protein
MVRLILIIVGAIGLVLSLLYTITARPRGRVARERVVEHDPCASQSEGGAVRVPGSSREASTLRRA